MDEGVKQGEVIVRGVSRWWGIGLVFIIGVATGSVASGLASSEGSELPVADARLVGCGADVTLILDVEDLSSRPYELHASLGARDRVLPLVNSMTHPLVGAHQDHQSLIPQDGRLLIVASVPLGKGYALQYELLDSGSQVVLEGVLEPNTCG